MIQIDMPMPTNCLDCPACNEYLICAIPINGRKWGENDVKDFSQSRPEWCPMKEQEAVNWTKCTDRIPNKDGEYLVVKSIMGMFNKIDVCAFALNLHEIDEFDFPDEERPGWYEHDSETGYFEWTGITHWAELPTMPDGIVEGR